jgi:hypothetical protein
MVKRRKEEPMAGVLEFGGIAEDDARFVDWLADHRQKKGGKIRVSRGATGARVAFTKEADMLFWKQRHESASGKNSRG